MEDEEIVFTFPNSGQKKVCIVKNKKFGECIKKTQIGVESISRVKKEVDIQKNLNSEFFPKIYYYEFSDDKFLIYEEYIEGFCLREKIIKKEYLGKEKEVMEFIKNSLMGLKCIWDKNIVHRDIKPENIIIRNSGVPVILDLGIAKNLETGSISQQFGMMAGTISYSSPEQILNNRDIFGKKSDIFSLGIVAYEMFFCIKPFLSVHDTIYKNCNFNINGVKISPDFTKILEKMLEKMPYNRYKSGEQIIKDIDEIIGGN